MAHIRDTHSHTLNFKFTCGLYGCPREFSKFSTFKTHVYDLHGGDPLVATSMTSVSLNKAMAKH